jgi:hypothetical protein
MNKENLLKLAEVLESPAAEAHFNMATWLDHFGAHALDLSSIPIKDALEDCGTVACIAGWAARLAKPNAVIKPGDIESIAKEFLGFADTSPGFSTETAEAVERGELLECCKSDDLFVPNSTYMKKATAKDAAKVVRHLVETGEVDWSVIDDEP